MSLNPSPPHPVRTVRDQIAEQLRNEILAETLPSDLPLRESALAQRFGTSRGPIRDVLLELTQEGALVYKPNAGVRVSPPLDAEDRALLMSLRRQIELHALPNFIQHLTPNDTATLRDILDTMKRACHKGDMPAIAGADVALHRYLVARGGSPALASVWRSIAVRIRMAYSRLHRHLDIFREHERIVNAILDRNLDAARQELENNLI